MTLSKNIFLSMLAQLGGRLYTSAVSFVVIMIMLARILTPGDFGIFNFYLNLYFIFVVFIDFGANTIVIRESSKDPSRLPALLRALFVLRSLFSLVSLVVVWIVAWRSEPEGAMRLWVCAASLHLLSYALGGFNTVFHVAMRFGSVALISVLGHTVFLCLSCLAYFSGSINPAVYLTAYGAGMVATNVANLLLSKPFIPDSSGMDRPEFRSLLREAVPLGFSSAMIMFYFFIDTFLLRSMQGEEAVGYYNAAYRILVFSIMVPVLFNQVVFPVYTRFYDDDNPKRSRLKPVFSRAVLYMGVTGVPAAVALWFFAEPLVVLICGERYARSASCLGVLGMAMALIFVTYPHTSLLIAAGYQKLLAWITGFAAVLNLGLNFWLIPRYSWMGAAWATVVTEGFVLISAVLVLRRIARLTVLRRELMRIVWIALIVAGACIVLQPLEIWAALPILAGGYLVLLFLFKLLPFNIRDETGN